ncbi:amino acid ABC transporter ATP-binding/permease protein [Alishewanella sp. SMS8]|uniref:amino acid ABC transporter ATP-binding/permease protein n=1 Tax=Alishewanella sp. SMS8 TaxID=2994676 RepID=UPI0027407765|nr:ATP-binding cassette domain-containing protein [Alishewanella sp. SMS8]MDP5206850.1 ATP-binding cassette domain-containing protein [Alishewanella sp. SMS9]MDP5459789.1 ATP-binding cassette domain-containing protein [Alishewanella sp. SMS8]
MPSHKNLQALRFWLDIFLQQNKHRLVLGALLAIATALSGIALLALSGWFITATAVAGAALLLGGIFMLDIYLPGGGIRFFALSRTVSRYFERLYNHDTVLRQLAKSRVVLFKGLQQLPRSMSKNFSDTDWLSRLTAELDSLDNLYLRLLLPPVMSVIATVFFFGILAIWLPSFALFTLGLLLLFMAIALKLFGNANVTTGSELAQQFTETRAEVVAHIDGLAELYASKTTAFNQQPLLKSIEHIYQLESRLQLMQARLQLGVNTMQAIVFSALLLSVLVAFVAGTLTGPLAVMFLLGWLGVAELLTGLPLQFSHLGKTVYAAKRLAGFTQTPAPLSPLTKQVSCIQCDISDHPQITSSKLHPLSLRLTKQQPWLLLTGVSGSGKSTVAAALAAEHTSPYITLSINQTDLTAAETQPYRQAVAYLEQQNAIFADTLRYNLQLGLAPLADADLWQVLRLVELDEWASALSQGLDTWLGEIGQNLSGGQARRLTLARLILHNPTLIILDEPFNGLDSTMAKRIWQNILPWLQGRFVLLLLHHKPSEFNDIAQFEHKILHSS